MDTVHSQTGLDLVGRYLVDTRCTAQRRRHSESQHRTELHMENAIEFYT